MHLKIENFLSYLLLILPISLISGPFLPDLIISISSIIFLFFLFYKRNKFFKNDFFIIVSIFYILIVINSFFSEQNLFSLKILFFILDFCICISFKIFDTK